MTLESIMACCLQSRRRRKPGGSTTQTRECASAKGRRDARRELKTCSSLHWPAQPVGPIQMCQEVVMY
ncbi:unnamed protein product [Pleuronectes platessa]|uniref:Uncharacterized protein n=1 Tax=Pleuronectes platessa TaxID=8262 RepID=A0A9N7UY59_PLEPL|nr:unnamed protein product [Pleuronectes platessa]